MAVRPRKQAKLAENQEVGRSPGHLCKLPDAILLHILSFLSMKKAVRTSVLSKRWEYLWTSIPNLRFTDCGFVDRALHLRDRHCPIKSFSLKDVRLGYSYEVSQINTWIISATKHNVEVLDLVLRFKPPYALPHCIFTCESLVKLHLQLTLTIILRTPGSVRVPNLKVLSLMSVKFPDEVFVQKLLSCPLLEELSLESCCTANIKAPVSVSSPKLRKLSIKEASKLPHTTSKCRFSINGASLRSFYYSGRLINGYCIVGASTELVQATINLYHNSKSPTHDIAVDNGFKLLSSLSTVKNLDLTCKFLKVLRYRNDSKELLESLPVFSNMTRLKVEMKAFHRDGITLLAILRKCPRLQHLEAYGENLDEEEAVPLVPVPSFYLKDLRKIHLQADYIFGTDREVQIIGILLKSAVVLEEMSLKFPMNASSNTGFLKKLRKFPRVQKSVKYI